MVRLIELISYNMLNFALVAKAHLLAYATEAAANQRYLISASSYSYQMFADIIRQKFPELRATTPVGNAGEPLPDIYKLDTTKIRRELGLTFRSMEESVVDTVQSLQKLEKKLTA